MRPADDPASTRASFVIIAYNQERYIREAVEGAFAQNYSPLEIILSDDCSPDRTGEIMSEMAARYRGPHTVRFVRNERNLGIVPHVFARGREALGEVVVMAAGDDISAPGRTATLVEALDRHRNALAVTSGFDLIDENGALLQANCTGTVLGPGARPTASYVAGKDVADYIQIQGSTAAYRRALFDTRLPDWKLQFSEDNLMNFLVYLYGGRIIEVAGPLISYRRHSAAAGNREPSRDPQVQEQEFVAAAEVRRNKMLSYRWIATHNSHAGDLDEGAVDEEIRTAELATGWAAKSLPARLRALGAEVARHRGRMAKWQAARLIGTFPDYPLKRLLSRR
ncbi:MAG TPA: glycosyltransferase [Allosphingosinicella sp.]|jgi:hypothetical protein